MNKEMITKIVKASGVSAGEMILVHFWGEDADKEIANNFLIAIASLGATPVLLQQSRTINKEIFSSAKVDCFDKRYFELLSNFDAVLDVFAYQPVILGYEIKAEQFVLYRKYISQLFYKLIECKRFTQIRVPTVANSMESSLDPKDCILRMTKAYDIDYEAVRNVCRKEVERFLGVSKVAIHTGTDCILHLELTGRTWHIDAGDGDLPCGEIYIAPIEEKTEGSVFFDVLYLDDTKYNNVTLQIEDGKVCDSSIPEVTNYFAGQPEENRTVCELGIGMNPNVTDLCGYTVLDEKMIGTFHIAVGSNDMFGGVNKASNHDDFVGYGRIEVEK
ncbi:MAG: aminopeptidase [Roseburia sp.]